MIQVTPANAAAVLKAAIPSGETLQFTGDFGPLALKDRTWAKPITLDLTKATFTGWQFANVGGVNVVGGQGSGNALTLWDCKDIAVSDGVYTGGGPKATGIGVHTGERITVRDCAFRTCRTGVALERVRVFTVSTNLFEGMFSDGVQAKSCWSGLIARNVVRGTDMSPAAHPDGVQIYSWATDPPCSDIVIENNFVEGRTEGVMLSNHDRVYAAGTKLADGRVLAVDEELSDGGFDRITIRGNRLNVSFSNAIAVGRCRGLVLENNHASTLADPTAPKQYIAKIFHGECTDVKLVGFNRYDGYAGKTATVLS